MRPLQIAIVLLLMPMVLFARSAAEREQCLADLDYVVETISPNHPNIYFRISETQFAEVIDAARTRIGEVRSALDCFLALKRVVASVQDGRLRHATVP